MVNSADDASQRSGQCSTTHITVYRAARQLIWGLPVAFTESNRNSCPSTKVTLGSNLAADADRAC